MASVKAEIRAPPLEKLHCTVDVVFTTVDDCQESTSNVCLKTTTKCTAAIRPSPSAGNLDEQGKSCVFYKGELVATSDPSARFLKVPSSSSEEVSGDEEPAPETPELSLSDFEYVALDQQQQEQEDEEEFEELFEPHEEEEEPSWCQRVWPWCTMFIVCCFVFLLATVPDGPEVYNKRYNKIRNNNNNNNNKQYRRVPT